MIRQPNERKWPLLESKKSKSQLTDKDPPREGRSTLNSKTAHNNTDESGFHISNRDWWVKVLGMMSHNWALIETQGPEAVTVYFFHDKGMRLSYKSTEHLDQSAVVDALRFKSLDAARAALARNDFDRLEDNPGPWSDFVPEGVFYDARATEDGVYSRKGYWKAA